MNVLVLGADGMLGHKVAQVLREEFDVWVTTRHDVRALAHCPSYLGFPSGRMLGGVDALHFDSVCGAVARASPQVVVNAVGIVKQLPQAEDPVLSIQVNALFPHQLAALCLAARTRLIHVSTDCVFSGTRGFYEESDSPDPDDLYGRTKLIGEVVSSNGLTLRTSIIGRAIQRRTGLLEWFLSQRGGSIKGFTNVIFSGLSTRALARVIADVIKHHRQLSGLYHVASSPISKFDLLNRLRLAFELDVEILPSPDPRCDRSLKAAKFVEATGIMLPTWTEIIDDLARDPTPYATWWRNRDAATQLLSD